MLKILKPFWNRASLGCLAASFYKGSRISKIPANGIHQADHHWMHRLSRYWGYFYACGVSVCGGGSQKKSFCFLQKKNKIFAGRRWFVNPHFKFLNRLLLLAFHGHTYDLNIRPNTQPRLDRSLQIMGFKQNLVLSTDAQCHLD